MVDLTDKFRDRTFYEIFDVPSQTEPLQFSVNWNYVFVGGVLIFAGIGIAVVVSNNRLENRLEEIKNQLIVELQNSKAK